MRNRRASLVKEISETEHEQVSTRILANYNHMHALTVQYYEVIEVYRVERRPARSGALSLRADEAVDFDERDDRPLSGALAEQHSIAARSSC